MDIIFYNGSVNTLDGGETVYSAVAAANGMVAALGTDQELRRLMGPKTEVIDLKGATLFPGFMEAHNHLTIYGYLIDGIDLSASNAKKMDDILALVKERTETLPAGTWIKGSRYAEYFFLTKPATVASKPAKERILPLWPPIPGRSARKRFHRSRYR